MSDSSGSNNGGIGLAGATFIVFLVLKLTHNIDWSWWWVTAPLWIPTGFVLGLLFVAGLLIGAGKGLEAADNKRKAKLREKARQERLRRW